MATSGSSTPVLFPGVMVSSTFTDLVEHRDALSRIINAHDLKAVAMENSSARPDLDVIGSSLEMVGKSAAYALVIGFKYGQTPKDPERNPDALSLTELEFNEALRLKRAVLLFLMSPTHPAAAEVEADPEKRRKLDAFRERAKLSPESDVERVYATFNDAHDFAIKATQAVARLRGYLDGRAAATTEIRDLAPKKPVPLDLYAQPPYIAAHQFFGREAQLQRLSEWAVAADPHPVLLFQAIGGAGKSMLTWEWTLRHAPNARADWAGRFWYSFYEKGAVMEDFCRRAYAYTAGVSYEDLRTRKMAELSELLLEALRQRPWLLVLDGLERVLVAYHRYDAAQMADEDAGHSDEISNRDPRAAIRPEDDDLLRALTAAAPSKLLITSRLVPRVLLNSSNVPMPGVLHEHLPGLRPPDAEALLRSCDVRGDSQAIQFFLKTHCDCHPLVTGVLAGLINDYLPDRGNFDAWASAPDGGAALNLADLDLVQKRNHILRAAVDALSKSSRRLLSLLALLPDAVDYPILSALDSQLPALQAKPIPDRRRSERAVDQSQSGDVVRALAENVRDLERRGLVQYDKQRQYYDLHPVVRAVAARGLAKEETLTYGQRVVDYFSRQTHDPYEQAETVDDVSIGLYLVRTLLQMERHQEAANAYRGGLATALLFNLDAADTVLSLIKPLFPEGWGSVPRHIDQGTASYLANHAGIALGRIGEDSAAFATFGTAIELDLRNERWNQAWAKLSNLASVLLAANRIAAAESWSVLSYDFSKLLGVEPLYGSRLDRVHHLALQGRWSEAETMGTLLENTVYSAEGSTHRFGEAEYTLAMFRFWKGDLTEAQLARAEKLAAKSKNKDRLRGLHRLRGAWLMQQGQWARAAGSLYQAVRMAREAGKVDATAETQLALANFHLGRLADPQREVGHLLKNKYRSSVDLAILCLAIGDHEQATEHALSAYEWAWADGEPYVFRYGLNRARTVLQELGVQLPDLPCYDASTEEAFPWEDRVRSTIDRLKGGARKLQLRARDM